MSMHNLSYTRVQKLNKCAQVETKGRRAKSTGTAVTTTTVIIIIIIVTTTMLYQYIDAPSQKGHSSNNKCFFAVSARARRCMVPPATIKNGENFQHAEFLERPCKSRTGAIHGANVTLKHSQPADRRSVLSVSHSSSPSTSKRATAKQKNSQSFAAKPKYLMSSSQYKKKSSLSLALTAGPTARRVRFVLFSVFKPGNAIDVARRLGHENHVGPRSWGRPEAGSCS